MPTPHLHTLRFGPEDLPPTSPLDLRRAWRAAHMGAEVGLVMEPGDIEGISFQPKDSDEIRFLFADHDAACWAAAVDRHYGLDTPNGVSLLFRLLALIGIMSEARWLQPFFSLSGKDGATLHPTLLAAAASERLSNAATFEPAAFKLAMGIEAKDELEKMGKAAIAKPATRKAKPQKSSTKKKIK